MQSNAKVPPTRVELIGAEYLLESPTGTMFTFGDGQYWSPSKHTTFVDDRMYVPLWLATDNQHKWHGAFVPGTRRTKMQAIDEAFLQEAEDALEGMERHVNRFQRAVKKLRAAQEEAMNEQEKQRQEWHRKKNNDKKLDEDADRIMQTINKNK